MEERNDEAKAEGSALIASIADFYDIDTDSESWASEKAALERAEKMGRLKFDESSGALTLKLLRPVQDESGAIIESLVFREPDAKALKVMDKYKPQERMAAAIHLASRITGKTIPEIERLGSRDMAAVGAIAGLFF